MIEIVSDNAGIRRLRRKSLPVSGKLPRLLAELNCYFLILISSSAEGNAVTEYAVCLALIVLACILAVNALGVAISELFPDLAELIN